MDNTTIVCFFLNKFYKVYLLQWQQKTFEESWSEQQLKYWEYKTQGGNNNPNCVNNVSNNDIFSQKFREILSRYLQLTVELPWSPSNDNGVISLALYYTSGVLNDIFIWQHHLIILYIVYLFKPKQICLLYISLKKPIVSQNKSLVHSIFYWACMV